MDMTYLLFVLLGALAGGFVNGLAGFGTGITALGIWLFVLSPTVAATLVVVCSAASQVATFPKIWRSISLPHVLPFILPGLAGVPLGTALLSSVDVATFKLSIGVLLLVYSVYSLLGQQGLRIAWGGRIADGLVGLGGGILGGLAGLSGPLPTVWADIRGWSKEQRRGLFQAFNLSILCAALAAHSVAGFMTPDLGLAVLAALPGTLVGSQIGVSLYAHISEKRFRQIVLTLLATSGSILIWTNL